MEPEEIGEGKGERVGLRGVGEGERVVREDAEEEGVVEEDVEVLGVGRGERERVGGEREGEA